MGGKCKTPPKGSKNEQAVWDKAAKVRGMDPAVWRQDVCGNLLHRDQRVHPRDCPTTIHGWHIDHKVSCKNGGTNTVDNLQVLQCGQNMAWGGKDWQAYGYGCYY